jgi:DNA-binding CsgD family transcriptional regulator|tara:strand:- start:162406 stop:162615 length:210 start_codon:yes stop_codon:yes gene_type:complete
MLDVGLLSKRELECLALLASGLRYQRIAFQLGTSVRTVEKQICSARIKLHAETIPQAIAIAVDKSLFHL